MANLSQELATHLAIRERLLTLFPELTDDDQALLDTLEGESNLDLAIIAVVRSAEDDSDLVVGIEERIEQMRGRFSRLKERIQKKRDICAETMAAAGIKKIVAPEFTLSLSHGQRRVIITDEASLPQQFLVQPEPPPPAPDKKAIAAAIKSGAHVPGAELGNAADHIAIRRS